MYLNNNRNVGKIADSVDIIFKRIIEDTRRDLENATTLADQQKT